MEHTYPVIDYGGNRLGWLTEGFSDFPCAPILTYSIARHMTPRIEVDLAWQTIGAYSYLSTTSPQEHLLCIPGYRPLEAQA